MPRGSSELGAPLNLDTLEDQGWVNKSKMQKLLFTFLGHFFLTLRLCEPTCRWPGVSRVKALLAGEAELSNMVLKFVETSFETFARLPPLVRTDPAMLFPDPGLVGLELEQDSVTAPVPLLPPPTTPPEPLLSKMSTSKSTRSWSLI